MTVRELSYEVDGWGTGTLWFADRLLVWHELPRRPETRRSRESRDRLQSVPHPPSATRLLARIQAYFAGKPVSFADVAIDLDWCTPFQRAVAETLRAVPYGEVVTYGELAALAGHPNAQRAAGTFCAHNRLQLLMPCHRVVSADGIGSYGSQGSGYKRRLLELEGVSL